MLLSFQVSGKDGFPFQLYVPVTRVDVIELFFARMTCICFGFCIKIFADMSQGVPARQCQSEGVACRMGIRRLYTDFGCSLSEGFGAVHHKRAEVEVIPYTSRLVIDDRMWVYSFFGLFVTVGIYHAALRSRQVICHTLQSSVP